MGWRPSDVRDCTLADFEDALDGWLTAQGIDLGPDFSPEAVEELESLMQRFPDTVH